MSAYSGRPSLAALDPSQVETGACTDMAVRGMLAALTAVTTMAADPSQTSRDAFNRAVTVARAHISAAYSNAFLAVAETAIQQLHDAAGKQAA